MLNKCETHFMTQTVENIETQKFFLVYNFIHIVTF